MNPSLQPHLDAVRRRLRTALASELVGRLLAGVAAAFWCGWLLDRWIEPPPGVRLFAIGAAAVGGVVWLGYRCVAPLLRRISDRDVAGWIEQAAPELRQTLTTAIEPHAGLPPIELELRRGAAHEAEATLESIDAASVVSYDRPRRWLTAAAVGAVSIAIAALVSPAAFGFYLQRVALSPEPWPRRVLLSVDGFAREADGRLVRRVLYGSDVELTARADLTNGHIAPPNLELRRRSATGETADDVFAAIGGPTTGDDAHQPYRLTIDRVGERLRLTLRGGDASLGPLWLIGERPPEVVSIDAEITLPSYLGGATRRAPLATLDSVPEGASVVLHGRSSKLLSKAMAEVRLTGSAAASAAALTTATSEGDAFTITCPPLRSDAVFFVRLFDEHGVTAEEPYKATLSFEKDKPPRATLTLDGIGPTVTPSARIPAQLTLEDDHGIADARLTVTRGEAGDVELPVGAAPFGRRFRGEVVVDLLSPAIGQPNGDARPEPGQRLTLVAQAADAFDLDDHPRSTNSRRFELTIVTPDELLARLQQREVNLRQTYEATVDNVRRAAIAQRSSEPQKQTSTTEPGDDDAAETARRVRGRRVADELAKSAQETLSAAEAFEHIYRELENNRIANDDLKDRIQKLIAAPLREIGERVLPAARDAVERLVEAPEQASLAGAATDGAVRRMEAVLEKMRSLETYNEVVAMLRQIIDEQQSINDATRRTQRDSLRRLLLD